MKILQTADIHIGTFPGPVKDGRNLRMQDTINCMEMLKISASSENPDLIVIAGDLFHRSRLWADEMLMEIQIAANWLTDLSRIAPLCLLYGTGNHDNMEAFRNLSMALPANVHIFTRPERRIIRTGAGPVQVCGLPGFDRGYFRAQNPGISREDENAVFSNALSQIVMGLRAECTLDMPSVLMAHYTVPGADLESGQVQIFSQSEPMLTVDTLSAACFDLVALGHIHKPQRVNGLYSVFYAGAINRLNFNDEGQERGFWYHELDESYVPGSRFVNTPARSFHTIRLNDSDIEEFNAIGGITTFDYRLSDIRGSIVRVLYTCTDEQERALNKSALEKALYGLGAFWVQEISPAEIIVTLDRKAMDEATTPEENLTTYMREHGNDENRIQKAVELARPIIADAIASASERHATGIMKPISIEVSNYRNYREASFDFSGINMCTINGQNGAGKSSLFMDAIVDCLYEEPREADLTGWIRADSDVRSGAITFTFAIGDRQYRVSRTRARSGKATLNLAEHVEGEWVNRSREKMRDTQEEIIALLGMDIGTFKSCALIMQDQYGIFLEAGKEQRMETLASMLGLGIYESMEEAAKAKAADTARAIRTAQEQADRLDDDLRRESSALADKTEAEAQIAEASARIESLRAEEADTYKSIAAAREIANNITRLTGDLQTRQNALLQAEKQREAATSEVEQLEKVLNDEGFIAKQAAKHEQSKQRADALTEQLQAVQRDHDAAQVMRSQRAQHRMDLEACERRRDRLRFDLKTSEDAALALMQYKDSAEKRDHVSEQLRELEEKQRQQSALKERLNAAQAALDAFVHDNNRDIASKQSEIKLHEERAALLLDSQCIDPKNAKCLFLKDAIQSRDSIAPLRAQLAELCADGETRLSELAEARDAVQTVLSRMTIDDSEINALRAAYQSHARDAAQYERREIHLERAASIGRDLAELDVEMTTLRDRLQGVADADLKCRELSAEIQRIRADHLEALTAVQQRQLYADQLRALPEIKARRNQAAEREQQLCTMALEQTQLLMQTRQQLQALYADTIDAKPLETRLSDIGAQIRAEDARKSDASSRLGSANMVLEIVRDAKQQTANLRREINGLSESSALYADLKQAFSKDGIPHNIIRSILPVLESTANTILSQMTGGKMSLEFVTERTLRSNAKKEVTTLDIFIQEAGSTRLPYLSKSGGEKVKVSLSVVLALSEIMSRRAGIQLGFLFIDEPPFLDDLGTQAYCDALEAIRTRYPGHIIMAITHDQAMKARFPQSIDIVKTDEGSKVVYT